MESKLKERIDAGYRDLSMWDGRGKGDRPQGEMLMRRGELINGASGGGGASAGWV